MKNLGLLTALLILLVGCSAPTDVAITQTGNPSQVALGFTVGSSSDNAPRSSRGAESDIDPVEVEDNEVDSDTGSSDVVVDTVVITSAELLVSRAVLSGQSGTLEFFKVPPYVVNVALDSSKVILDSLEAEVGAVYDSVLLYIEPDADRVLLGGNSVIIRGYINNNPADTFSFEDTLTIVKPVKLDHQLMVKADLPNRVMMKLDISNWFYNTADEEWIDPNDEDFKEDIRDNIEESIYGDEDHEEDDDDDIEEEHNSEPEEEERSEN